MSNLHVRVCATNPIGSETSLTIAEGEALYERVVATLLELHYRGNVQLMLRSVDGDNITIGCEHPLLDELGLTAAVNFHTSPWYWFFLKRSEALPLDAFDQLLYLINALAVAYPNSSFVCPKAVPQLAATLDSDGRIV